MDISTITNICLCILSFLLAVVSVITVIVTLKQNSTMIENSSRAYVSIYGDSINCQSPNFYIVVKNFGCSNALITSFQCDTDLSKFSYDENFTPFSRIENTSIAPNQAFKCTLNHLSLFNSGIPTITFRITYKSNNKNYSDTFLIHLDAFPNLIRTRAHNKDNELTVISEALQELDERLL